MSIPFRLVETSFPETLTVSNDLGTRLKSGDEKVLQEIIQRSKLLLNNVVMRVLHCPYKTEVVLCQLYAYLYDHPDSFDPDKGNYTAWLVALAYRKAIDARRRMEAYDRALERYKEKKLSDGGVSYFDDSFLDNDRHERLRDLLNDARIPEPQREALKLTYFRCLSHREIARQTGLSLGTVKTRIELSLKKIGALVRSDPVFR